MGKRIRQFTFFLGLLILLVGCMSQSGEDFYALPQLPEDYLSLQKTIGQEMSDLGAEYAAPASGANVQIIQFQDLDGDGLQESVVAFFRVPSAERPLRIYIFRQNQNTEEYETHWIIEGTGTGIYTVAYENLGGSPDKELIVSWQISANAQTLSAYSLQPGGEVVELMRSGYTKGALADMDQDNKKEIVLAQLDTAENNSRVELYNYNNENGVMALTSTAPLSLSITNIQAAKEGCLSNLAPALFVSSDFGENGGRVTDIITVQDGELVNLTLDEATGISSSTVRYYKDFLDTNGADINNDGILELPIPEDLPLAEEESEPMYLLHWNQYGPDGAATRVCTTFHCYEDGWYFILPDEWVGQITAARRDGAGSLASTERGVGFFVWPENAEAPVEFLTIYRLTGTNRARRAAMDERFTLLDRNDVIFAAKLHNTQWDYGLDSDGVLQRFNRIRINWSTEN